MAIKPQSLPLKETFSLFAKGNIAKTSIALWDKNLYRQTRLLVPVDLQAMVVTRNETTEHAQVAGIDFLSLQSSAEEISNSQITPKFFQDLANREAGVYLHWALPDALTAGHLDTTEEGQDNNNLRMPALPNRWVVMRIEEGEKRKVKSWVIESEIGRATPLAEWKEGTAASDDDLTPRMKAEELTADSGGDLAWTAIYDTAEMRFAFHDDLQGVGSSPLVSYCVNGWYSEQSLDPLAKATTINKCTEILREHGWEVDDAQFNAAQKESESREQSNSTLRLKSGNRLGGSFGKGFGILKAGDIFQELQASIVTEAVIFKPLPIWPQQSIFHGVVYDVSLQQNRRDNRPRARDLKISIGQNSSESLASLIASQRSGENAAGERLHLAFQYKMTDVVDDADGLPQLEETFHKRSFDIQDGGYITELVRSGDPFAHLKAPQKFSPATNIANNFFPENKAATLKESLTDVQAKGFNSPQFVGGKRINPQTNETPAQKNHTELSKAAKNVMFDFSLNPKFDAFSLHDFKRNNIFITNDGIQNNKPNNPPTTPLHYKEVKRALPRLHTTLDPVLSIRGIKRNLRHGYDGRFDANEKLNCRLSGNTINKLSGIIDGKMLLAERFDFPNVPPEVEHLLYEAILNDPSPSAIAHTAKRAAKLTRQSENNIKRRLNGEAQLKMQLDAGKINSAELVRYSMKAGILPSPIATTNWSQPWVPLYLEWELSYFPSDKVEEWKLGELDFIEPEQLNRNNEQTIQGRSLLNSSNAKSMANTIHNFLVEEDKLDEKDRGVIDEATETQLKDLNENASYVDILNSSLEGLRDYFLGFDTNIALGEDAEVQPSRAPELLVSGHAKINKLRILDAFGRKLDIPQNLLNNIVIANNLHSKKFNNMLEFHPRLTQPSRLWFRFVDAENDRRDAHINQQTDSADRNPIAGWLLADHVDRALEFFSGCGEPLGQLRHAGVDNSIIWDGVPGKSGLGVSPTESIANPHVAEFARSMVERDAIEQNQQRQSPSTEKRESLLNALLRVIDTTLWTIDPFGSTGNEFYSSLTGRPIAIVRARLKLEVISDINNYQALEATLQAARKAAYEELYAQKMDVKLGALNRFDDGLLGYFINDNYQRFYPVHKSVPAEAIVAGRFQGFAAQINDVAQFAQNLTKQSIDSSYIEKNPTVSIRAGQSIHLTLLMDPSTAVHATSGILPRKSITLPRAFIEAPLVKIAPSFRFGPVLVDPKFIRMPKPKGLPEEQVWTRRDSPNSWKDDPITAATQEALLPDTSAQAQEGYIRINIED